MERFKAKSQHIFNSTVIPLFLFALSASCFAEQKAQTTTTHTNLLFALNKPVDFRWSGDTPQNWCFQLGAISPDAAYTYSDTTANVVPFSWAPTDTGHNYNLIPNLSSAYVWLGPFTCDDKTLTCTTIEPQYQPFPS